MITEFDEHRFVSHVTTEFGENRFVSRVLVLVLLPHVLVPCLDLSHLF